MDMMAIAVHRFSPNFWCVIWPKEHLMHKTAIAVNCALKIQIVTRKMALLKCTYQPQRTAYNWIFNQIEYFSKLLSLVAVDHNWIDDAAISLAYANHITTCFCERKELQSPLRGWLQCPVTYFALMQSDAKTMHFVSLSQGDTTSLNDAKVFAPAQSQFVTYFIHLVC